MCKFWLVLLLFVFSITPACAVVINEFSSASDHDWIELYSAIDTDISGWIIRDTASTIVKKIESTTIIGPSTSQYLQLLVGERLNKDGDDIKLLHSDDQTIESEIKYGKDSDLCLPTEVGSLGRFPDNSGSFTRFILSTPGQSNNSTQDPCPTPTPSPSPSPLTSLAPTPSPTPTPTPSRTPTPTPTPTQSLTPSPTLKPSLLPSPALTYPLTGTVAGATTDIDLSGFGVTPSPSLQPDELETDTTKLSINKSRAKTAITVGSGLLILSLASLLGYRKYLTRKSLGEGGPSMQ
jgi:hypothetical protein